MQVEIRTGHSLLARIKGNYFVKNVFMLALY